MSPEPIPTPVQVYLERRAQLVRYFTARTGSHGAAEDIVQDIYLRLQTLTPDDLAQIQNPQAYLYRLGANLMLDRIKADRRRSARDDAWRGVQSDHVGGHDIAETPSAEDAAYARLKLDKVIDALNELSPSCRRAFRLHKLEGLSHSEAAQAMGVSRSAIEKHMATALRHLLKRVGWP